MMPGPEDMAQRQQLDAPPTSATIPPRQFVDRAPDGVYSSPPPPVGYPEPVAYLTMGMEFAKASPTFLEAIGAVNVTGRRLGDVAAGTEAEKISLMQSRLVDEQKRREPNYLPPILGLGGLAFQGMGFGDEDVTRFPLNIQDQLAFVGPDGYARHYPLRVGLGKEGSFFFVVMLLSLPPRYPHPASMRIHAAGPYHGLAGSPEAVGPRAAASGPAFDPIRHRVGGSPMNLRSPLSLQNLASRASPAASPGVASPVSPYGVLAGAGRGPPDQAPHGPGASGGLLPSFAGRAGQQRFQLPPIRAHSEQRPAPATGGPGWRRDERLGRVDIEGLIDRPEEE